MKRMIEYGLKTHGPREKRGMNFLGGTNRFGLRSKMNRKLIFSIVAILALLLCLSLASQTAQAQQPKHGGRLVVAIPYDPVPFNPALTTLSVTHTVSSSIYSTLLSVDWDLNFHPNLAKSYEKSANHLSYTFQLVRNAKWHDGKPFTSADVKYTFETIKKVHPAGQVQLAKVERIETPDPYTVVFHLNALDPTFLLKVSRQWPVGAIIPKHIFEGTDIATNPATSAPIGTGPFRFKEWKKGGYVSVVKNKDYFKPDKPYLDEIVFAIRPDPSAMLVSFEAGEIDYLWLNIPRHEVSRLQRTKGVKADLRIIPGLPLFQAWINLRDPILSNKRVRQAMHYAMDLEEIRTKAFYRQGTIPDNPLAAAGFKPTEWAYEPNCRKYPNDIAAANRLLDEAGYPKGADGMRFTLEFTAVPGEIESEKTAELLRDQFKRVGINLDVKIIEAATRDDLLFKQWKFQLAMGFMFTGPDPSLTARQYTTKQIKKGPFINVMGYSNPRVDELYVLGDREIDRGKRGEYYREIARNLMEEVPELWFIYSANAFAYRSHWHGLPPPTGMPVEGGESWENVWSEK